MRPLINILAVKRVTVERVHSSPILSFHSWGRRQLPLCIYLYT